MFNIVPSFPPPPQSFRSVCESCGVGNERAEPVIECLSAEIDHQDGLYTNLYLCSSCVREWGRALGMIDIDTAEMLRAQVAEVYADLHKAQADLGQMQTVKAAIEAAIPAYYAAIEDEEGKVVCPECGDRVKKQGIGSHRRLKHEAVEVA